MTEKTILEPLAKRDFTFAASSSPWYGVMLKHRELEKDKQRLLILKAVESVANQMLKMHQSDIENGTLAVSDIVEVSNRYVRVLLG